jgi:hypothetical protein
MVTDDTPACRPVTMPVAATGAACAACPAVIMPVV